MKRKISLLLILALMLTSLVACKGPNKKVEIDGDSNGGLEVPSKDREEPEDNNEEVTITVQVEKGSKNYYQKAANRVKDKHPDSNIKFIEKTTNEHLELLDTSDATDEKIADLFTISLDKLYSIGEKDVLGEIDVKSIAKNLEISDDYDKGLTDKFKVDEKYLAFPMNINTLLNFVNIKNAKTNEIDFIKEIEFTELSNEDILMPIFDIWYGISFMNAGNIELLTKMESGEFYSDMTRDFSELDVNQEEIFKAMFNYWYYSKEESLLFSKDEYLNFMDTSFKTGGSTFIRPESINAKEHLSKLTEGNVDIFPMEKLVVMGNTLSQWKDGDGLAINPRIEDDKKKMEIVEAMIEEIVNPEYAIDFFKETGRILENISLETYIKSDLDDIDKSFIKAVYSSYEKAIERPISKEWKIVSDTWEKAMLSWNTSNPETVEDAYKILQNEFKEVLNSIK